MDSQNFRLMLENHDWYYMMSEDSGVYRRGIESRDKIADAMRDNEELRRIYSDYLKEAGLV